MRPIGLAFVLASGASACAALSGLSDYQDGLLGVDASFPPKKDAGAGSDVALVPPFDGGEIVGDDVAPDDAPSGDDQTDAPSVDDGGPITDASMVPDGYACGVGTCGGCCTATGDCVGGQSVSTCGTGGEQCKNCSSQGACNSAGACVKPVIEAGPPPKCMTSTCTNSCSGAPIQGKCCKSDNTCGCQWTAFAPCN